MFASTDFRSRPEVHEASAAGTGNSPNGGQHGRQASLSHSNHSNPSTTPSTAGAHENRVTKASSVASANGLNPRSCVTCRRRKVKCDKKNPCSNCVRQHIDCVFPAPGRAPRKPRKPDSELLDRLRRLEGVVKGLGVYPEEEALLANLGNGNGAAQQLNGNEFFDAQGVPGSPPGIPAEEVHEHVDPLVEAAKATERANAEKLYSGLGGNPLDEQTRKLHEEFVELRKKRTELIKRKEQIDAAKGLQTGEPDLTQRFGRLVVEEGRSRYINNSFWASLNTEVEDIKLLLNDRFSDASDDDDDNYSSPTSTRESPAHQGYIFGYSSTDVDMAALHPPPEHIPIYWGTFIENVDPLVKVLHIPSMSPTILAAASRLGKISKGLECLMFAIYYAVATSCLSEDCVKFFGEERQDLLQKYRFGIEQALARANFLCTDEIVVLQAMMIFLICLRRNDDAKIIWTMTGLVVRIAQTLGIHRDGSHYSSLTPFQAEMRRRLWWQVCILDTRASEDHGCDPTITESVFDTRMPLNINDSDITPDMEELPESKVGCTEMTFGLIRFEVANMYRRLQYVPPGPKKCGTFFASISVEQKEVWLEECLRGLEEKYLRHIDTSVPLYWVIGTVSRLMLSKAWLIIFHPFQRLDGGASLPPETRDKLFITSLENLEYSLLLETEARTRRWGWLFQTYVQWHAIAFLLSELCIRTKGEYVERAWRAVETITARQWSTHDVADHMKSGMKGHLWKPLRRLMAKAKAARHKTLAQETPESTLTTTVPMKGMPTVDVPDSVPPGVDSTPLVSTAYTRNLLGMSGQSKDSPYPTWLDADPFNTELLEGVEPSQTQAQTQTQTQSSGAYAPFSRPKNWPAGSIPLQGMGFSTSTTSDSNLTPEQPKSKDADVMASFETSTTIPSAFDPTTTLESPNLNDNINWENWDDMVREFGMDIDQNGQPASSQFVHANAGLHSDSDGGLGVNPYQGFGGLGGWY